MDVRLRDLEDTDLDQVFIWEQDPSAVAMAAFTRADPSDRAAFDQHYQRVRNDPDAVVRVIVHDGSTVGTIASFTMEGVREISYWIDRPLWGQGVASAALTVFLTEELTRPLYGRVAEHNVGSAKVLARAGFVQVGTETSYADGVARDVVEHSYRLT